MVAVRGRHPGGSLAGYLPGTCVDPSWGGSAVSGGASHGQVHPHATSPLLEVGRLS